MALPESRMAVMWVSAGPTMPSPGMTVTLGLVNAVPIIRMYGGAIGVVSGLYAILMAGADLVDVPRTDSMEAPGIGGWVMLAVGVAALIHGILLFTPVATGMGGVSGPLMLLWATVMVGNQVLAASVADWGMAGTGMGMEGADSNLMEWDPGMVAIGVLMFISGLIMIGRRSGEQA